MKLSENIKLFKTGLIQGIGWSIGVTIGFVIVSTILVSLINLAGGIPVIGEFSAKIVESTLEQLNKRSTF